MSLRKMLDQNDWNGWLKANPDEADKVLKRIVGGHVGYHTRERNKQAAAA